jgi:glycosyltransferase involved in cell wall biosynthesis
MKIALIARENLNIKKGGDTYVILKIKELLEKNNIQAELILNKNQFKEDFDLYHLFNLGDFKTLIFYIKQILKNKKKFILNPTWYKNEEISYAVYLIYKEYSIYKNLFNLLAKIIGDKFLFNFLKTLNRYRRDVHEEYILKKASAIIIESKSAQEALCNYFSRLKEEIIKKSFILPLPINERFLGPCKEVNLDFKDYVLNVGRIEPFKNQIAIIKALLDKPEIPIVFVGDNYNFSTNFKFFYNELEFLIKKRGNVIHIKEASPEELIFLYKNAKVYCHPSIFESYGLSILEAAYFGCNLVITKNCGVKDYLEDNIFLVDPFDIEELKEKIILALNTPKTEKNIKIILDWDFYIQELLKIYNYVLNA